MDIREKILLDREERVDKVRALMTEDNLVVTLKVNIVGNNKNIDGCKAILDYFCYKIEDTFDVQETTYIESYDGNYYIIQLPRLDYVETKLKLIYLESTYLGRLVDIDLFSDMKRSISRADLGVEPRRCIVCGELYNTCLRNRAHTLEDVLVETKKIIKKGLMDILLEYTKKSMIQEVKAHPKLGLVTEKSMGSHTDMNYNTFLLSIDSLMDSFKEYLNEGFSLTDESLKNLRTIGIQAEKAMFKSTGNINTHKGAIFLLGFLLPSLMDILYRNKDIRDLKKIVVGLSKPIEDDFKGLDKKSSLTYGEKIYLEYGITGVRGIPLDGFEVLLSNLDKIVVHGKETTNDNVIKLLLLFMMNIDDTTLLHRHEVHVLDEVKEVAKRLYEDKEINYLELDKVSLEFTEKRLSPGGSADMVILALILQKFIINFRRREV